MVREPMYNNIQIGKRTCQLKIQGEPKNVPSRNNGGWRNRSAPELNEKEVIELLKDLSNTLEAF